MKPVVHLSAADAELAKDAVHYDDCEPGVGERFVMAVEETELWIQKNPETGGPHLRGASGVCRAFLTESFTVRSLTASSSLQSLIPAANLVIGLSAWARPMFIQSADLNFYV